MKLQLLIIFILTACFQIVWAATLVVSNPISGSVVVMSNVYMFQDGFQLENVDTGTNTANYMCANNLTNYTATNSYLKSVKSNNFDAGTYLAATQYQVGPQGNNGSGASVVISGISITAPGTPATCINLGTSNSVGLFFTFPQASNGLIGVSGTNGLSPTVTYNSITNALGYQPSSCRTNHVTLNGTSTLVTFNNPMHTTNYSVQVQPFGSLGGLLTYVYVSAKTLTNYTINATLSLTTAFDSLACE